MKQLIFSSVWDEMGIVVLLIKDRLKYMPNTSANFEMIGSLLGQEVRKRITPQEKIAIIQQTMGPGMK